MQLTPLIATHIMVALTATLIGPFAMWARKGYAAGKTQRPKLHRALGYAWVTCMLLTAITSMGIRDYRLPNIAGYTPIHVLVPFVFTMFFIAFWALAKGNIRVHRLTMVGTYIGACLITGALTLMPTRLLGQLVWHQWLGWL
jgi:uncharacterized membrane protein